MQWRGKKREKKKKKALNTVYNYSGMTKFLLKIHKGTKTMITADLSNYTTKIKISNTESFNMKITISEIITSR